MYARAVTSQLHLDKSAKAERSMEAVAEQFQGADGFHEITLLADETTGHGHIICFWESEAAIAATAPTIFEASDRAPGSAPGRPATPGNPQGGLAQSSRQMSDRIYGWAVPLGTAH